MDGAFPDAFQHVPLWFPYGLIVAGYSWIGPLDIASVITPGVSVWLRERLAPLSGSLARRYTMDMILAT